MRQYFQEKCPFNIVLRHRDQSDRLDLTPKRLNMSILWGTSIKILTLLAIVLFSGCISIHIPIGPEPEPEPTPDVNTDEVSREQIRFYDNTEAAYNFQIGEEWRYIEEQNGRMFLCWKPTLRGSGIGYYILFGRQTSPGIFDLHVHEGSSADGVDDSIIIGVHCERGDVVIVMVVSARWRMGLPIPAIRTSLIIIKVGERRVFDYQFYYGWNPK